MSYFVRQSVNCINCGKITEYLDNDCLNETFICNNCGFNNPNEKQFANLKEYANNALPLNTPYDIIENRIYIDERYIIQFLECTDEDLNNIRKKGLISRIKSNGVKKYDFIQAHSNYQIIKIIISPDLWFTGKMTRDYLSISSGRVSTLRKNRLILFKLIKNRYYYELESLIGIKQKLTWPTKNEVMEKLKINTYQFNKLIKDEKYPAEKIGNRWYVNLLH